MKGYQFLEMDFFELCKTRRIHKLPMLLFIYLRGLYCRFQKPVFTWSDKIIREHLGITSTTLLSAKEYLQERGMIKFMSGSGRTPTEYTMLGTSLLPVLRVLKIKTLPHSVKHSGGNKNCDPYNTIKERLKNRIGIFQGLSEAEREELRVKGLLNVGDA